MEDWEMPASIFNIYQAKTQLSQLVERAAAGEEILIARAGTPVARLVPVAGRAVARQSGGWAGQVIITGDFDDPLPAEIMAAMTGAVREET